VALVHSAAQAKLRISALSLCFRRFRGFRSKITDRLRGFERGVDLALELEALFALERQ
jgi:hypothetical protein